MPRHLVKSDATGMTIRAPVSGEIMAQAVRAPKAPSMSRRWAQAFDDVASGAGAWRMWLLLGMNDIRQRYRRSRIGQFWITLAMATTIVSLGVLYAYLFKMSAAEYLPYLGVSFIVWGLISNIITDSCSVFIGAEAYMRQAPMPKSVFVHRMLVRNVVIFLHNLVILPPLFMVFGVPVSWNLLLAPAGIALIIFNGVWLGLLLGALCARFRDLPQIIASLMQVVFYVTPVMWRSTQLPPKIAGLASLNPFESFLDIVRDPLLGAAPPALAWGIAIGVTVCGSAVAAVLFARFRARIVYWL
jgi:ABC-type polysaccharide/polyol phosphate export permease